MTADSPATGSAPAWTRLTDLARRDIGGAVVWATDESFAEKENLITPGAARFDPEEFGHKGKVYDGWETRRRRVPGEDHAIIRLGVPGVLEGVVVDTSWFLGNYPPEVSVSALNRPGYATPEELAEAEWTEIVPRTAIGGGAEHHFDVASDGKWTHVRLTMHPDGGIARFRAHGTPCPDPAFLRGTVDLAAMENGGHVTDCSNLFYSSPDNLLARGLPANMGGGWENARRRGDGNDHVEIALAGVGVVDWIELDTSYFVFNAPGAAKVTGRLGDGEWRELVPRTPLLPDTRHRYVVEDGEPIDAVRVDVYPDGGMARVRVMGTLTEEALADIESRW